MATYTVTSGDTLWAIAVKLLGDGKLWQTLLVNGTLAKETDPTKLRIGSTITTSGTGGTTTSPGVPVGAKNDLVGIPEPDFAELWYDTATKTWYLAYGPPDPNLDFTLLYKVTDPKAIVPPGTTLRAQRTGTLADFAKAGALTAGSDVELANFTEHPFSAWQSLIERQAEVRPWLRDEEVLALLTEALLEGRELTEAEFQGTDWWQSHNAAQRQWLLTAEADPAEAAKITQQNQLLVSDLLRQAGVNNAPSNLVNFLGAQFTQGNWSATYLNNQIRTISDPAFGAAVDPALAKVIAGAGLDTTREGEDRVRELAHEWLGGHFGNWAPDRIESWAGRIRNDPDAEAALVDFLRGQRLAIPPEYKNENLTYQDVAEPWRSFASGIWGQTLDDSDPLFIDIVRTNDAAENAKKLRGEGIKRRVGTVVNQLASAVGTAQGGGVRRPI